MEARGVRIELGHDWDPFDFTIRHARRGFCSEISFAGHDVTGILNLGTMNAMPEAIDADGQFIATETAAAAVAALAVFDGPVLNRPRPSRMFGLPSIVDIGRGGGSAAPDWMTFGASPVWSPDKFVNAYSLVDGSLLGRYRPGEPLSTPRVGGVSWTAFDPDCVSRLVLVPGRALAVGEQGLQDIVPNHPVMDLIHVVRSAGLDLGGMVVEDPRDIDRDGQGLSPRVLSLGPVGLVPHIEMLVEHFVDDVVGAFEGGARA